MVSHGSMGERTNGNSLGYGRKGRESVAASTREGCESQGDTERKKPGKRDGVMTLESKQAGWRFG